MSNANNTDGFVSDDNIRAASRAAFLAAAIAAGFRETEATVYCAVAVERVFGGLPESPDTVVLVEFDTGLGRGTARTLYYGGFRVARHSSTSSRDVQTLIKRAARTADKLAKAETEHT